MAQSFLILSNSKFIFPFVLYLILSLCRRATSMLELYLFKKLCFVLWLCEYKIFFWMLVKRHPEQIYIQMTLVRSWNKAEILFSTANLVLWYSFHSSLLAHEINCAASFNHDLNKNWASNFSLLNESVAFHVDACL